MDQILEHIISSVNTLSYIAWDNLPDGDEALCEQTKQALTGAEKEIRAALEEYKNLRAQLEEGLDHLQKIINGGEEYD